MAAFGPIYAEGEATVPGIAASLIVIVYIRETAPVTEGELRVPVLESGVTDVRNGEGVPHIRAASDAALVPREAELR